eukprot:m.539693 g.539693  ORF g.539693 m.539693 type:complete len:319 (+) comp57635_c0_seq17:1036-1992(+)
MSSARVAPADHMSDKFKGRAKKEIVTTESRKRKDKGQMYRLKQHTNGTGVASRATEELGGAVGAGADIRGVLAVLVAKLDHAAKIADLQVATALVVQHVARLDVSVCQVLLVQVVQRHQHLVHHVLRYGNKQQRRKEGLRITMKNCNWRTDTDSQTDTWEGRQRRTHPDDRDGDMQAAIPLALDVGVDRVREQVHRHVHVQVRGLVAVLSGFTDAGEVVESELDEVGVVEVHEVHELHVQPVGIELDDLHRDLLLGVGDGHLRHVAEGAAPDDVALHVLQVERLLAAIGERGDDGHAPHDSLNFRGGAGRIHQELRGN